MNRREFLNAATSSALGAALPALAASGAQSRDALSEREIAVIRRDVERVIDGNVFSADDAQFLKMIAIDNGRIQRPPYLVVAPSSTDDIAAVVRYCAKSGLRLTTKSGGHSGAGYCLNSNGLLLDLSNLGQIVQKGPRTLSVGLGTRWIQVYDYVQANMVDHVAIGGGCGSVGLGGFLLGGGYSFVSRSYGMGCDSVTRIEFVSADGDIYQLRDGVGGREERELIWALRGGGGGNFGIASAVDIEVRKRPSAEMLMGSITFAIERAEQVLSFYGNWIETLPDSMAVYGMLRRFADPRRGGETVLGLRLAPIYNGRFSAGVELLRPLLEKSPVSVDLYSMTLPQWESFIGNGTAVNGRSAYIRSVIMAPGKLTDEVAAILVRYMTAAPSPDSYVVWTHSGGQVRSSELPKSSCFAHRDGELTFELKSIWSSRKANELARNVEWAIEFFDELDAHGQGAYVNYIDPLLPDWARKYYRESYPRLLQVKKHWDPKGRFDFQQGVGSEYRVDRTRPLDLHALRTT